MYVRNTMNDTKEFDTYHQNEEQPTIDESLSSIKFIPRLYIPKGKITLEHAKQCIFPGETISHEQKLVELKALKNDAKEWFRNEISKIMVAEIQSKDMTLKMIQNDTTREVVVRNFDDFIEKVEQDSSDNMMRNIFDVSHVCFDLQDDWQLSLEEKYMREFKFQYAETSSSSHKSKGKGCFEIICCGEKTELVKRIQRAGKRSHGKYITLELPRKANGGYTKRKLGIFYPAFVKNVDVQEISMSRKTKRYREVSYYINNIIILFFENLQVITFHCNNLNTDDGHASTSTVLHKKLPRKGE